MRRDGQAPSRCLGGQRPRDPGYIATAHSEEGEIMALSHRRHPVIGLQFHPEAVLTDRGYDLLRAFLAASPAGRSAA